MVIEIISILSKDGHLEWSSDCRVRFGKETTHGLFKHSLDQISLVISDKIFK